MTDVVCKQCKKTFNAKPSWIKNGNGIYCSSICQYQGARKGKVVNCFVCDKETYKKPKALAQSKSGKFFCSKSCQTRWRNSEYIQERHPNWRGGKTAYRSVLSRGGVVKVCKLCKTVDKRVLAVHHVDENRMNNAIENLVWLCHNCHHLVHRYRGEQERLMAAIV